MDTIKILDILSRIIDGYTHPDRMEAIEPHEFAEMVFAKEAADQKEYIGEQRIRETAAQKDQRLRLTNPITAAALAPALAYVEELQRTDGVFRSSNFSDANRYNDVSQSLSSYYAGQSVQDFLFQAIKTANEKDPNSWLIFERKEREDLSGYDFYPVLVESEQVVDWKYDVNGHLKYLVFADEEYKTTRKGEGVNEVKQVSNFYLYAAGYAAFAQYMGEDDSPKYDSDFFTIPGNEDYIIFVFETGTLETPAVRLGAYQSGLDANEPCELLYEAARGHLKDLMRLKSSHDLNEVLHMYPKLFQYVKACTATEAETGLSCIDGYYGGDHLRKCGVCNGTGKIVHAGEQDVVTFKFPDTKEEFVDLAQVATYMSLPLDVFTNQQEQIERLCTILTFVIYSQEQTERVQPGVTATEIAINYSRIYNKLYPIAQKWAECEAKAYRVAMQYYGSYQQGENYFVQFPMDFAMKTEAELIADLAAAKLAGAPYAVQKGISDALLKKKYKGDQGFVADQLAFDALKPFSDKSAEELAMILATRAKTDSKRVAWENWQEIQHNILQEIGQSGLFALYPTARQRELITAQVQAIIDTIPQETNSFNQLPVFQ
jgi:hypothetical protein